MTQVPPTTFKPNVLADRLRVDSFNFGPTAVAFMFDAQLPRIPASPSRTKRIYLQDEEIEAIAIESNHTIDVDRFVPRRRSTSVTSTVPILSSPTIRLA